MKVCQLCAVEFSLRHFLLPLIDGMTATGWEVTSVCSDSPGVAELRQRGYRIETVPLARNFNVFAHLVSVVRLVRLFRRERFDVLHAHTPVAALVGRLAARLASMPLTVYTAHGFYFHEDMPSWKRRIFVALERLAGQWTDLLLTQSEEDAHAAVTERIMLAEHVLAIGNGVDATRFDPRQFGDGREQRSMLGIPEGAHVVGFIGRQVREKGIVEFLEAACSVAALNPDVWFLMVGERLASDYAAGVEKEVAAASAVLGKRLVLAGLRRDIPEMLAAMHVFCLPSWREGMPRTIIEAMMMARPVVATDIRGAREEVVQGTTGLLVPVRAPEELAAAIKSLISDPARAQGMGVAGRERALLLYDERNVIAKQIACIGEYARRRGLSV